MIGKRIIMKTGAHVVLMIFFVVALFAASASLSAEEIRTITIPAVGEIPASFGEAKGMSPEQAVSEQQKKSSQTNPDQAISEQEEIGSRPEHDEFPAQSGKFTKEEKLGPEFAQLERFGYDLFQRPLSTFAPVTNVPVGPGYVIGPGDNLRITVWGKFEGQWNVTVDRDGTITLPKIGVTGVAGMTFGELKEFLYRELSKYYTGFEMNVSMEGLRTITVYVVGDARKPGAYTVSSLSTLINALFAAGGPSEAGTMRDIQIKRNGETIVHFDLYDLILKGDRKNDIRLMPEDVLFIPVRGPLVGVSGKVKKPAIYELKEETSLLSIIEMAGGLSGIAYTGRIQIKRIENHMFRKVLESDLVDIEGNPEKNIVMLDGDLVTVFTVADAVNTIKVTGAVVYPGEYGIEAGKTFLKDVFALAGGPQYYASDKVEITRIRVTPSGPVTEVFSVSLSSALNGDPEQNVPLEINDHVFLRPVPEWGKVGTVGVYGEVLYPGEYRIRAGETISSLIERAGGFTKRAYLEGAVFTRVRVRELQQKQVDEMVERLERELMGVGVSRVSTASSSDEARLFQLELQQKRQFIDKLKTVRAKGRVTVLLQEPDDLKRTPYDLVLEDGDALSIPTNPGTVQVVGSVYNQTAFVFEKEREYDFYVDLAGGYTANADDDNVYILKANGSAVRTDGWRGGGNIESGDTIIVPVKLERIAWMRNTKDITQILYQIAVAAGVLIVVF